MADYSEIIPTIFGGTTNLTLEQLKRRQAVAAAIAAQKRKFPTTLGEGLSSFGESVGDALMERGLIAAEARQAAADAKRVGGAPPSTYGTFPRTVPPPLTTSVPPAAVTPPPASPPVTTVPVRPAPTGGDIPGSGVLGPRSEAAAPAPVADAAPPVSDETATRLTAALMNNAPDASPAVMQANPTSGALMAPPGSQASPDVSSEAEAYWVPRQNAMGGIESGGERNPYTAIGRPTVRRDGSIDRPFGRYQIMGDNIPEWTQAAIGREVSIPEFLNNSKIQDAVFRHRFGQYINQYGDEGAARAWLGGPGGVANPTGSSDVLGTTPGMHGQNYMNLLRGQRRSDAGPDASGMLASATVGDTASDAPPIIPRIPGVTPDADENPPTPTDIPPGPASVRTQIAQAPPGVIPGSVAMPGLLSPLPGAPGAIPTGSKPSTEPIPPASEQQMKSPGPPPDPPQRLPLSPNQRYWLRVMSDPNAGDGAKATAQREFELEEKARTEVQTRLETDYTDRRERWQKLQDEYDKFVREGPDRAIKQLTDRLAIQKTGGDIEKTQTDIAKTQLEIEKMLYEKGIPREQARQEAALKIQQAIRNLNKPDIVGAQGTHFERPYDPNTPGAPLKPFAVPAGLPPPEEKPLTEPQQKGVQFVIRTTPDLNLLDQLKFGKILTVPSEAFRSTVPGIHNLLVSDEYRRARNAVDNWAAGFLTHVSGAAVSPSEAARNIPAFVPMAGDTDQDLIDKARRRRDFTDAVGKTTGRDGLQMIQKAIGDANDEYLFRKASEKPAVRVTDPAEIKLLEPGTRLILPDGTPGQVPKRTR